MPRKTTSLLFAAALVSLAVAATCASADSVGALQVNGLLFKKFAPIDCAAGIAATTQCFRDEPARTEGVPGLGDVSFAPYTLYWDDFGAPCARIHAQIPILVAGKGEIDLAFTYSGCWTGDDFPPIAVDVSGGSGRYAGASGRGVLVFHTANLTNWPTFGSRSVSWTGTLNVAGLTFDTTPPQIAGAKSKAVKTRAAAGARVRYSVAATDATDGPVPAACLPRSGSVFRVGRTIVTCTAADGSGNSTTASFAIAVQRVRR